MGFEKKYGIKDSIRLGSSYPQHLGCKSKE